MSLSPQQVERYARHLVLKEIGGGGQQALLNAKVLIIGAGGLGCPVAMYLAAAGIGTIGIVDDDLVSLSNLQRQVLFTTKDVGKPKTESAISKLRQLNPDPIFHQHNLRLDENNIDQIISRYDYIIDGCDNFPTRFLVNQKSHQYGKTLISGAVGKFDGQVSAHSFASPENKTACYQCLVPAAPPEAQTCEQVGVVGALTGIIGSVMALECIKLITDNGQSLLGRLLIWDGLGAVCRTVKLNPDPDCSICGKTHNPIIMK
ncbi:MAG: HesA/MoeB/ThiF family protein [Robiginitomaculum sp.]|nr:HesA/MoeB/ThiF family protein [Robiginitomaculum sp.]